MPQARTLALRSSMRGVSRRHLAAIGGAMLAASAAMWILSGNATLSCEEFEVAVGRAGRSAFFDPTHEGRTKAAREVLQVLPAWYCGGVSYGETRTCKGSALLRFEETFRLAGGDPDIVPEAENFYGECGVSGKFWELQWAHFETRQTHPEPRYRREFWRLQPEDLAVEGSEFHPPPWYSMAMVNGLREIFKATSDPRERVDHVLRLPGIGSGATIWALDELTADPDPREWKPEDVAVMLFHARRCFRDGPAAGICEEKPSHSAGGASWKPRPVFQSVLAKMGVERSINLMNESGLANITLLDIRYPDHFPFESELYASEGAKDHEARREKWLDTDRRGPSLDLGAVRTALKALDKSHSEGSR